MPKLGVLPEAVFIPETGQPCYLVGPVVLQAVLQTFGGTDGWGHQERLPIRAAPLRALVHLSVPLLAPNPVDYHRSHRNWQSRRLLGAGASRVVEYLEVKRLEAGLHNVAAACSCFLIAPVTGGWIHQAPCGLRQRA
jgi:hypothetical protein